MASGCSASYKHLRFDKGRSAPLSVSITYRTVPTSSNKGSYWSEPISYHFLERTGAKQSGVIILGFHGVGPTLVRTAIGAERSVLVETEYNTPFPWGRSALIAVRNDFAPTPWKPYFPWRPQNALVRLRKWYKIGPLRFALIDINDSFVLSFVLVVSCHERFDTYAMETVNGAERSEAKWFIE